ncbi:gap junction alpha-4 protein [Genypterus blacodes]|uniref:gap junction alpha-4 protein n=1 Tax=Genypterus blacodes TaxID=154954 RepID=UPI003F75EA00
MSRADWSFLEHLLEEGQEYSTGVGRIWLTVLFLFRMLVLGTAAESAWDDEQADFVCNTRQPGCTAVCYDKAFPISHFRYFVLQVIFVSTPTIFYFGYVAIRAGKDTKEEEVKEEEERSKRGGIEEKDFVATKQNAATKEENKAEGGKGKKAERALPDAPKLKGSLLCAYTFSILLKVLLEAGFMVGLWFLYDGYFISAKFECVKSPCPHKVDCFVSRPTEKTIFTIYTQVIAGISLLLNLIELLHLLQLAVSHRLEKRYQSRCPPSPLRAEQGLAHQEGPGLQAEAGSHLHLPVQGEDSGYPKPCDNFVDQGIEVNWGGHGDTGNDVLPSYLNCMGGMRSTHSPRIHQHKKHTQYTSKNTKGVHKAKKKHYV